MRSALAAVKGVSRAVVKFEGREAYVNYDPAQCRVEDLIAAVARVKDASLPTGFSVTIKKQEQ